jgi:hypothetical protein
MKARTTILFTFLFSLTTLAQKHYPLKNLLGVNVTPDALIASQGTSAAHALIETANKRAAITSTGFTWLRIYIDADAVKRDNNTTYLLSPDGRGYQTDEAIAILKQQCPDLKINICYQNKPQPIATEWGATKSTVYRHPNSNPYAPESYSELAHDCGVLAGRGGTNVNAPDYPLFIPPNWWEPRQQMLKGSTLYNQIEGINEGDNQWSNQTPMDAAQYFAALKSIYDSVKKYDPNMLVSSSGVMTEDPQMLADILTLCRTSNNGKVPFDKYQFHCYGWGWSKNIANGISPEYNTYPATKKVVAVSNGIPCVVGEWGYDLHPNSDLGVRPFSNYTAEQVRAYFSARSIILFSVAGIESAYNYRMYQDDGLLHDDDPQTFQTASLFWKDANDNIKRRLTGDVFRQLLQFGDFVYDATIIENDSVRVYRFRNGGQFLFVGWTVEKIALVTEPNGIWSTNRAVFTETKFNYTFPTAGIQYDIAEDSSDNMKAQPYYGTTITLSSKPTFVVTNTILPIKDKPAPLPHTPTPQWYHANVYDYLGRLLKTAYINNQNTFEKSLPRGQHLFVHYFNEKTFTTHKVFNP